MAETTAEEVAAIVRDTLGAELIGAYLHGSAVLGGLRPHSDIDVLAVVRRPTTRAERGAVVEALLGISGHRARRGPSRPVELTVVVQHDVRPWRYPPRMDLQYGEWLRDDLAAGRIAPPVANPDLAPVLTMALRGKHALVGRPAAEVLDPVPPEDLRRAIVAGVPDLVADLDWDTRNVLLTLARVWTTLVTGQIGTKDHAASWALQVLPTELRTPLTHARAVYLGEAEDRFADLLPDSRRLAHLLVEEIGRAQG